MKAASRYKNHGHARDNHAHAAGHTHGPRDFGAAFAIGTALNLGFVILEAVYGLLANSLALVADAATHAVEIYCNAHSHQIAEAPSHPAHASGQTMRPAASLQQ